MRALLAGILLAAGVAFGQGSPEPLMVTRVANITSTPSVCTAGSAQCVDNRSSLRRNDYHSISCTGTGSWTAELQYSATGSAPWNSFGAAASIDQSSNPPIAYGNGYQPFIRVAMTGSPTCQYSGSKQYYLSTSVGATTFPITVEQGGTGATTASGARTALGFPSNGVNVSASGSVSGVQAAAAGEYLRRKLNTTGTEYEFASPVELLASDYDFPAQTFSTTITTPGDYTFNMAPCPLGVSGSDTGHRLRISGGVGTAEGALISGGTCTSGAASGTIQLTVANAHSGSYTISSATAGIQEALNVLAAGSGGAVVVPCGTSTVYDQITIPSHSLTVRGLNENCSVIAVASTFPTTRDALFFAAYENVVGDNSFDAKGWTLSDLSIFYDQPDSDDRDDMTQYPWVVSQATSSRALSKANFRNLRIARAWNGFYIAESDGFTAENIRMSAFNLGFDLELQYDSTRIDKFHCFPFDLTANQTTAFFSAGQKCISAGRADDLRITNSFFYGYQGTDFHASIWDGTRPYGSISDSQFDTGNGIVMSDGNFSVTNTRFLTSGSGYQAIKQTGGKLRLGGGNEFFAAIAPENPFIEVSGSDATLIISGGRFQMEGHDQVTIEADDGAQLSVTGAYFVRTPDATYNEPIIIVYDGARATLVANTVSSIGSGAGSFASFEEDNAHNIVAANNLGGWNVFAPATLAMSIYGNANVPAYFPRQHIQGSHYISGYLSQGGVNFSGLSAEPNGTRVYCPDCRPTSPCSGGGDGAFAERLAGVWNCGGGGAGQTTQLFDVRAYGAIGDGSTDDSAAINAAIAAAISAGGGTVFFPTGTYLMNSQVTISASGSGPSVMKPLRFQGVAAFHPGGSSTTPSGGSMIKIGYSGTNSFIAALGVGTLEITGITFQASSTSAFTFLTATNTGVWIHHNAFIGATSLSGTDCVQDAIVLGGTSASVGDAVTSGFQGYGSVIDSNYFDHIRRAVYLKTWANNVQVVNNTVMVRSGSNLEDGAAIEIDGGPEPNYGNYIAGNLIEVHDYPYAIKLKQTRMNVMLGNGCWDETSVTIACVRYESTATGNFFLASHVGNTKPLIDDDSGGANSFLNPVDGSLSMTGPGDFAARLKVTGSSTSTVSAFADQGAGPNIVQQTSDTDNNWIGTAYHDSSDTIVSGIGTKITDHESHLGELCAFVRSATHGFAQRICFTDMTVLLPLIPQYADKMAADEDDDLPPTGLWQDTNGALHIKQ